MAVYSKVLLSGGTSGRNILVAATASPGTLIHTAHATALDEIHLWAVNSDTANQKLTIEFGGTTAPNDTIEETILAEDGAYLIIPGWPLTGGLIVRAWTLTTGNLVTINGFVNRIT
jgi:hypothetical protein